MKFSNCHFIGCGGTGSYLIEPLAKLLSYHNNGCDLIHLYDGDIYEDKNLERQIFPLEDLGKNKAEVTAKRIAATVPDMFVSYSPEYVTKRSMVEALERNHHNNDFQLIIVAVDKEHVRHSIIEAADYCSKKSNINFAMILPGNEYDTAICLWYCRLNNIVYKTHPFDNAINWKEPTDKETDSCQAEAVSAPQLISANLAAAFMSHLTVEKLLNDHDMPYKLSYSGKKLYVKPEGKFKVESDA